MSSRDKTLVNTVITDPWDDSEINAGKEQMCQFFISCPRKINGDTWSVLLFISVKAIFLANNNLCSRYNSILWRTCSVFIWSKQFSGMSILPMSCICNSEKIWMNTDAIKAILSEVNVNDMFRTMNYWKEFSILWNRHNSLLSQALATVVSRQAFVCVCLMLFYPACDYFTAFKNKQTILLKFSLPVTGFEVPTPTQNVFCTLIS